MSSSKAGLWTDGGQLRQKSGHAVVFADTSWNLGESASSIWPTILKAGNLWLTGLVTGASRKKCCAVSRMLCHLVSSALPTHLYPCFLTVALDLIHFERLSPNPYEASKEEGGHDKISQNYEELGNSDLILDHHSAGLIDPPTVQHGQIHLDASQSEVHSWIQLPNVTGTATSDSFKQQQVPFIAHTPDKFWNQDPVNHQSTLEMLSDPNNSLLSKELTQQSPFGTDNLSFIQALNSGEIGSLDPSQVLHWNLTGNDAPQLGAYPENSACLTPQGQPTSGADSIRPSRYFITDANCYRRLEKELTRFVLSSLSPNNPGQHVCTEGPCLIYSASMP